LIYDPGLSEVAKQCLISLSDLDEKNFPHSWNGGFDTSQELERHDLIKMIGNSTEKMWGVERVKPIGRELASNRFPARPSTEVKVDSRQVSLGDNNTIEGSNVLLGIDSDFDVNSEVEIDHNQIQNLSSELEQIQNLFSAELYQFLENELEESKKSGKIKKVVDGTIKYGGFVASLISLAV